MDLADKRKELCIHLEKLWGNLNRIDSIFEHIDIMCDKCKNKEGCHFVYNETALLWKNIPLKAGQKESDFSKKECMFYTTGDPKFEYLKYSGKKRKD